jgi:hypothetical protein
MERVVEVLGVVRNYPLQSQSAPGNMGSRAAERLFKRMQQTKTGWRASDFARLYEGFGFRSREGGNHTFYWHPEHPDLTASVGRHGKLAPRYAFEAVDRIRQLKERGE